MAHHARVLIVDADEQVRALLSKSLRDRGVGCEVSADVVDALRQLSVDRYALVVVQLEMDNADHILGWARSLPVAGRPMILMTADIRSHKDEIDTEIVQIIIRRPLRVSEVAGLIRACLDFLPGAPDAAGRQRTM